MEDYSFMRVNLERTESKLLDSFPPYHFYTFRNIRFDNSSKEFFQRTPIIINSCNLTIFMLKSEFPAVNREINISKIKS